MVDMVELWIVEGSWEVVAVVGMCYVVPGVT